MQLQSTFLLVKKLLSLEKDHIAYLFSQLVSQKIVQKKHQTVRFIQGLTA